MKNQSVVCTREGETRQQHGRNWAAKVAYPWLVWCGAAMRWPAKMRVAGDCLTPPSNFQSTHAITLLIIVIADNVL